MVDLAALSRQVGTGLSTDIVEGNGSGIVLDDTGLVLTNWHVLMGSLSGPLPKDNRVAKVTVLGERRGSSEC